jgi:hypothetical protein
MELHKQTKIFSVKSKTVILVNSKCAQENNPSKVGSYWCLYLKKAVIA